MRQQIAYLACICCLLCGCSRFNFRASTYSDTQNPIATITLGDEQKIVIELYPELAPNTVNNFISLIEDGYYDGLTFHRIIEDYIIQTGDPLGNNYGSPGYTIQGEFKSNGFKNKLKHVRGIVSMARGSKYDSAGSQFFITMQDLEYLNGYYAAFGKVIEGMETLDCISKLSKISNEKSKKLLTIKTITIDTKTKKYPDPIVVPINET